MIAPYSAADAKGLLKAAIRCEDPVVFLENELLYGQSFEVPKLDDYVLPIGKARIARAGSDVTIVSYSIGVGVSLDAAARLAEEGIEAEVIDLRTLRPLDRATVLASLSRTNRMVVVEEGWPTCSIASEIIATVMEQGFDDLDAPVLRVTNVDVPVPYAANLEIAALLKAEDVVAAVKTVCLPLSRTAPGPAPEAEAVADPERALVLTYAPASARGSLAILWRLDERLGAIVAATTEPMIGRIRLAWWREALEALDKAPPPAEPLLRDIAEGLLPAGIPGSALAAMEAGWAALIDGEAPAMMAVHARERGGRLFGFAATLMGVPPAPFVARAGEGWALADLAHRLSIPEDRRLARDMAAERLGMLPRRWPVSLRALGALALLARRDTRAERRVQGSPARVVRTLLHRLTGF